MTEQTDIINIIRRVIKQWMIIGLIGVIAALGAGIVTSRMYRPQYETKAIIVVYDKSSTGSGRAKASETVSIFQEIITSNLLQKRIAETLEIGSLPGTISCEVVPNTNMITMKARANTPKDAMIVMNGVLDYYEEAAGQLLGDTVLRVLEEPSVPIEAVQAYNEWKIMGQIFLAVVVAVSGLLVLVFYFRDDIKNEKQVEQKLDTKLFSTVYHENLKKGFRLKKRKGKVGLLLTNPVTSFGYIETFRKIGVKFEYRMKRSQRKVLLVTSVQENEGKSTVSANLALSLARDGKRVLLVDADVRKPAQFKLFSQTYEKEDAQIGSLLVGQCTLQQAKRRIKDTEVYLLAGNRSYKNATKLLTSILATSLYEEMRAEADYVIIDTPPLAQAADAEELMRFADAGLLVVRQNHSKVKDINDAIDVFKKTGCRLLGCVLNDVEVGLFGSGMSGTDSYQNQYGYGYGYYKKKEVKHEQERRTE